MKAMRLIRICLACLLAAGVSQGASADNASHREAAVAFYQELREDSSALSKTVAGLIGQLQPGLLRHRAELEAYAQEMLNSPAFLEARVGVYMDLLGEEELRTLTWLFRHETMRKYRSLNLQLVERNTEAMISLFRRSLPDLQRRISEKRGDSAEPNN